MHPTRQKHDLLMHIGIINIITDGNHIAGVLINGVAEFLDAEGVFNPVWGVEGFTLKLEEVVF